MDIRYLKHEDVNKQLWDERVRCSANGLIYASSWYLDCVAPGWHALVSDDYKYIMPVPVRRKALIKYVYQPSFCQQLGIIGEPEISQELIESFIAILKENFSLIKVNLNHLNKLPGLAQKINFTIDLNSSFDIIQKGFRKDLLTTALKNKLQIQSSNADDVIHFFRRYKSPEITSLINADFNALEKICSQLARCGRLHCREVISENKEDLSKAIFFEDEKRLYYILSATSEGGKKSGANPFLIAETIREFSQRNLLFDFEGSSIPSIQFFFKKFNPETELYPVFAYDNLPFFVAKIKSIIRGK